MQYELKIYWKDSAVKEPTVFPGENLENLLEILNDIPDSCFVTRSNRPSQLAIEKATIVSFPDIRLVVYKQHLPPSEGALGHNAFISYEMNSLTSNELLCLNSFISIREEFSSVNIMVGEFKRKAESDEKILQISKTRILREGKENYPMQKRK